VCLINLKALCATSCPVFGIYVHHERHTLLACSELDVKRAIYGFSISELIDGMVDWKDHRIWSFFSRREGSVSVGIEFVTMLV